MDVYFLINKMLYFFLLYFINIFQKLLSLDKDIGNMDKLKETKWTHYAFPRYKYWKYLGKWPMCILLFVCFKQGQDHSIPLKNVFEGRMIVYMGSVRVTWHCHPPETLPKSPYPRTSGQTTDQEFRAVRRWDYSHALNKDVSVNNRLCVYHGGPIRL